MSNKKIKNKKNNNKKNNNRSLRMPIILLILAFVAGVYIYSNNTEEAHLIKKYYSYLNEKNYEAIYDIVETNMEKDEFVNRMSNIYEGIEANNITVRIIKNSKKEENSQSSYITYKSALNTVAGDISFSKTAEIINNDNSKKIKWDSSMIFPDLEDSDKIRVKNIETKRGTIYDRNGFAIAKDSSIYEVGIKPGKLTNKSDIYNIAELLNISEAEINEKLNNENVTDESFVSLKKISKEEQELKNNLLRIKGIIIDDKAARVYPYKEATSIMTGYTQDGEGKTGLEYSFNDLLKGENGAEIYIENEGKIKKTLAKKDAVEGKDIKLTIDVELQKRIYEEYKEEKSATVSIDYNTGEVLALVSTPSYDANKFSVGMSAEEWEELQNNENKPMFNRYLATYSPGSTMKPIIGAIGIENNIFKPEEEFEKSGLKWQEDDSWGSFYISTLEEYNEPSNLQNALVYSDNIFFAKVALKIGKDILEEELNKIGFEEQIDFEQELGISSFGKLDNDKTIACTGFGQAEVMVNPVFMASIYSCFANQGNMMKPYLVYEENEENRVKVYKENAISLENANIIKEDLQEVVKRGTASKCYMENKVIAGKTGTAEIKNSQQDENGTENGWFNSFDEAGHLFVTLVEDVKERGGSEVPINKTRAIYEGL